MNIIINKKKPKKSELYFLSSFLQKDVRKAIEFYGLSFDNEKLDKLLGTGLKANTLTYLYGREENSRNLLNILTLNSVRYFGGLALFVDAGNSADPYLIRKEADLKRKDSLGTRKFLKSIKLVRVFTCHQLANFVTEQLPELLDERKSSSSNDVDNNDDNKIRFVGVSGIDSVFSTEDSTRREILNLQFLIARKLSEISKDRKNGVKFVVASSREQCQHFLNFSDVAIEIYCERKSGKNHAALMKHPSKMHGIELEL